MLTINDLQAAVEEKQILKGINLDIKPGEVHAIMGPNGSGKSTLSKVLAGRDGYAVQGGKVEFQGEDLLELSPEERAHKGLFLGFQHPVSIPGVSNIYFLKAAYNAQRKARGEDEVDAMEFLSLVRSKLELLEMDQDMIYRGVNDGFSGGEKKRNQVLQMLVLQPKMMILDETDSGLDIDALRIVSKGINAMRGEDRSFLLITHYQRMLDYVEPDFIHVLSEGRIVKSGGRELALELEKSGYAGIDSNHASTAG